MLQKLRDKLAELAKTQQQFYRIDTSQFNDPIADTTDWIPLNRGGASFKTHNLKQLSNSLLQYKLSGGGLVFLGIFGVIGLIFAIVGLVILLLGKWIGGLFLIFGSLFVGVSFLMYRFMGKPVYFDAKMGCLWKGHQQPKFAGDNNTQNSLVYFSHIHAIQIIKERVRGNKTTYASYELNMVLKDGSRFNVMDHGGLSQLLIDAETLSKFIGKPIWNAI